VSTHRIALALLRTLLWSVTATLVLAALLALSPQGTARLAQALTLLEPRLELAWRAGNLLEARFARIAWRDGELAVALEGVAWTLAPRCLLSDELCFAALEVGALDIDIGPPSGEDTPLALAPVVLPLPLVVDRGTLGTLTLRRGGETLLGLQDITLAGSLRGSLVDIERLAARRDDLAATLAGHIELRGQLPLSASGSIAQGEGDRAHVSADGDLARLGFRVRTEGRLALDAEGSAELLARPVGFELRASSRAALQSDAENPVLGALHDARLSARGTSEDVQAQLEARLESSALGSNALTAALHWVPGRVELSDFHASGAAGQLSASGELATGGERRWHLQADARDFCPPGYAPALRCRLSGVATLDGALDAPHQGLVLGATLQGEINGHAAALSGRIEALADGRWRVDGLRLQSGANSIAASGTWGASSQLEATLLVGDLADTVATARGRGHGRFTLRGSAEAPALTAELALSALAWQDAAADTLEFAAEWQGEASEANRARLTVDGLRGGSVDRASIEATLAGSLSAHRITLDARAADQSLRLECGGALGAERNRWRGNCPALTLAAGPGATTWRNDRPLALGWQRAEARFAIEPFCLQSDSATLCSRQRVEAGNDMLSGLRLSGTHIPAAWFGPWLPAGIAAGGELDLGLEADKAAGRNPRIDARLAGAPLSLTLLAAGEAIPLALEQASATLRSRDAGLGLEWRLALTDGAEFSGALTLGDSRHGAALDGSMTLRDFDLAPIALGAPGIVAAAGSLGGTVRLAGTLRAPTAAGSFRLRDGRLEHERLALPLEDIGLEVEFADSTARLAGSFAVGGSTGTLDGSARFDENGWAAEIGLHAAALQLEPMRGSPVTLIPDLRVRLEPQRAIVSGELTVPTADIRLDRLPATAVSVSTDTVIVGAEPAAPPLEYTAEVRLVLGPAVRLRGRGVDARLDGSLALAKKAGEPLRARGEIRVPEGRYTAHGQQLEVTEGEIRFRGPLDRPELRLTAVRRIEDENIEVGVRVRGDLQDPELRTFSRPAMEESRALYYLLTGRAPDSGGNTELAVTRMLMALGGAGASRLTGGIARTFGIQDFQVDTSQVQGGTEVHLSGYLSPDLYLRYGVSTFDSINTFRLRYRLTDSFHVEAVSGIENAVDFLYSFER